MGALGVGSYKGRRQETANLGQFEQIANGTLGLPFTLLLLGIFGMVRALCAALGAGLVDSSLEGMRV